MNRFAPVKKHTKPTSALSKRPAVSKAIKSKPRLKAARKTSSAAARPFTTTTTTTPITKPSPQQSFSALPTLDAFKSSMTASNTPLKSFNTPVSKNFRPNAHLFKPTCPQHGLFTPLVRAYKEQSYESPESQTITDLPPLGSTIPLKQSNDEWEMCYDGTLGRTLIYLKKMSITSVVLSIVSFPAIVTFPTDNISLAGKVVLALSSVLLGVGSTIFTNVFCSAYVCRAFVNRKHPNIVEFTTAGFTGKYEAFRFDVTEPTTDNVERPLTSFKHLATDRHFFVAPQMISHPVWGMILPHLFDVEGEELEEGAVEGQENDNKAQDGTEALPTDAASGDISTEQTPIAEEQSSSTTTADATDSSPAVVADDVKVDEVKTESAVPVKEAPVATKPAQKVVDAVVDQVTAAAESVAAEAIKTALPTASDTKVAPPAEQKH